MQALEKLTLAYLVLQERAEKLQADKDAMFFENQTLQAKYKKTAENNRFLQRERNKWFDAYNELNKSNEALTIEQAEQMHNLKECIEELEGQCVELQAKLDALQPAPTDGYEAEKRVCRAASKDSETPNDTDEKPELYHTIYDNPA
jgi:chromosome segregation ATPase